MRCCSTRFVSIGLSAFLTATLGLAIQPLRAEDGVMAAQPTLESLSATLQRPLFVPSRRPPPPVPVVTAPASPAPPAVVTLSPPSAQLMGIVRSVGRTFAVFKQGSKVLTRTLGDDLEGWRVKDVTARSVVLMNADRRIEMELPKPKGSANGAPPFGGNPLSVGNPLSGNNPPSGGLPAQGGLPASKGFPSAPGSDDGMPPGGYGAARMPKPTN
jgi:hypothetical protein